MLLIDKYRVQDLLDVWFHQETYRNLVVGYTQDLTAAEKLERYKPMPNLFVHGPPGAGKHTFIRMLLQDIYGKDATTVFKQPYVITGYGNSDVTVELQQSNCHIVVEPHNSALDKYIIQEVVKDYARQNAVTSCFSQYPFRTVVIDNVDNLNYYAQTSLRCTMEKYHKTCRFIICGFQAGRVLEPIKSRCLNVRIPAVGGAEVRLHLEQAVASNKISISTRQLKQIVEAADGNIRTALWLLDMHRHDIKSTLHWKVRLESVMQDVLSGRVAHSHQLSAIRQVLYDIFTSNIDAVDVMRHMLHAVLGTVSLPHDVRVGMADVISVYETRLLRGKRSIIHLEGCILGLMKAVSKYFNKV